jgi:hypothetical protein
MDYLSYSRYAIAWKWKDSDTWRLWLTEDRELGTSYAVTVFQWPSDPDHKLPNAKDFIEKIRRPECEYKIVEIEHKVREI